MAIELVLMLRLVFHLAPRQAEGFCASVLRLLGQDLRVPDHRTLSRRSRSFGERRPKVIPHGLQRRSWQRLHLSVDADTGEIVANVLADNSADDAASAA